MNAIELIDSFSDKIKVDIQKGIYVERIKS